MKLHDVLIEWVDVEDFDGPDMEDRGHLSFAPVLDYITNAWNNQKLSDWLDGEYGNYRYWDSTKEDAVMQSLEWLQSEEPTNDNMRRLQSQLKTLERRGIIGDENLIRDKRGI